jgi:hypothetical protein
MKILLDTDKTRLKCARCLQPIGGPLITENHIARPLKRLDQILFFHVHCYEEITQWLQK